MKDYVVGALAALLLPHIAHSQIQRLELVQAVQNADQTVPLVAGKSAYARVYPGASITGRAVLRAKNISISSAFVRADSQTPIHLTLPESWTTAGDIEIDAELSGIDGAVLGRLPAPSAFRFRAAPPLRVHYVRVCAPDCPNANVASLAAQVLPIGDNQLGWESFGDLYTTDPAALLREVATIRTLSDADLMVVLRREPFGETLTSVSAALRIALVSTQADTEANVAHAILALMGAPRVAHTINAGDIAWNRLSAEIPTPRMFWIASDTFAQVFNSRAASIPSPAPAVVLTIGGSVRRDGSAASFRPGFRVAGTPYFADPTSTTCIRFSADETLATSCFATLANALGLRMDDEPFLVSLALPAGARRIALLRDGRELASINVSANAPVVQATAGQALAWTATDADGGSLTYRVFASADGGTPRPLGLELADRELGIDPSQIPPGSAIQFHVHASDGVNTGVAITPPIAVARTPGLDMASRDLRTGDILVGRSQDLLVPLRNRGNGPLSISARGDAVRIVAAPSIVPPGSEASMQVRVQPDAAGPFTGSLTLATNDPDNANVVIRVSANGSAGAAPAVTAAPAALAFGEVGSGESRELAVFVRNEGGAALTVTGLGSTNEVFQIITEPTTFSVAPGGSQTVTVRFSPLAGGGHSGSLVMTTNDPARPSFAIAMTGSATGPPPAGIEAETTRLDFGSVAIGDSREAALGIRNTGSQTLIISSLSVQGDQFSIIGDRTLTVTPGSRQTVTLRFSPTSQGGHSGLLTIASSDSIRPLATVALVGTATGNTPPTLPFHPLLSDSFGNRIANDLCALGAADHYLGGTGNYRYLPLGTLPSLQVSNGALINGATGFNGVLFASRADVCSTSSSAVGVGQSVNFRAEVLLPPGTQAGPIFLSRFAAARETLFAVGNTGVWVQLHSTGEVKLRRLDTAETLAASRAPQLFDNSVFHVLDVTIQNNVLTVRVDGGAVAFATGSATVPTPISGGVAGGIGYGSEPVATSGQRIRNMVVSVPQVSLAGPIANPYVPNPPDRPAIEVSPATYMTVDSTLAGQTRNRTFVIRNNGGAMLTVNSIRFGSTQFAAFPATPFNIAGFQEQVVTMRFAPISSGSHTTDMIISSSDPRRAELLFTVVGTATVTPGTVGQRVIQLDDGTFEKFTRFPSGGYAMNRLKPPAYPATLRTIQVYIPANSIITGTDITVLFKSITADPGTLPGGGFQTQVRRVSVTGQFIEIQIASAPKITSGDFVVGFHIGEVEGKPIAMDTSSTYQENSFVSYDGLNFISPRTVEGFGVGNFAIRAIMDVPLQ